jgi:hypothetical protein
MFVDPISDISEALECIIPLLYRLGDQRAIALRLDGIGKGPLSEIDAAMDACEGLMRSLEASIQAEKRGRPASFAAIKHLDVALEAIEQLFDRLAGISRSLRAVEHPDRIQTIQTNSEALKFGQRILDHIRTAREKASYIWR